MINNGISFICEGETELVFYQYLIDYFCTEAVNKVDDYTINTTDIGEEYRLISANDRHNIIKMNCVSTISQITNSEQWINNECFKSCPNIPWTIFLCYDTDSYLDDITQFYENDWKVFRENISESYENVTIVDLAASAEIEDVFLLDSVGIACYLNADIIEIPSTGRGKSKLKSIFRKNGKIYHEGMRAEKLISSLDFKVICDNSPIDFSSIKNAIWGEKSNLFV